MKKIFLAIALLIGISGTSMVNAQDKQSERNERRTKMHKELNLSTDQQTKMNTLHDEFSKNMENLRNDKSLDKDARDAKRGELMKNHQSKVKEILTPEQQAKFDKMQSEKKMKGNKRGERSFDRKKDSGNRMNMRGNDKQRNERSYSELNLSDTQKEKIQSLNKDFRSKRQELSGQHHAKIQAVLTPEQKAKMDEK